MLLFALKRQGSELSAGQGPGWAYGSGRLNGEVRVVRRGRVFPTQEKDPGARLPPQFCRPRHSRGGRNQPWPNIIIAC